MEEALGRAVQKDGAVDDDVEEEEEDMEEALTLLPETAEPEEECVPLDRLTFFSRLISS